MGFYFRTILAGMVAVSVLATAACADDQSDSEIAQRMFAGNLAKSKLHACFVRRYDAAHLVHHPLQKVSAMKLLVSAERVPEDAKLAYSFRLGVNFRDRPGDFASMGNCASYQPDNAPPSSVGFGCSVDCDGGGIGANLAEDNASIMVTLDHGIRIWKGKNFAEDAATELTSGDDDKAFRLDRADLNECADLVTDRKELAAMRRK
jgi:hypothetical protein